MIVYYDNSYDGILGVYDEIPIAEIGTEARLCMVLPDVADVLIYVASATLQFLFTLDFL